MRILPDPVSFIWDQGNIDKNLKHEVKNKEAEEVFENKPSIFKDEKHSITEKRYGLFGQTDHRRLLSIVFTIRKDKIRIITARDMSKRERRAYDKIKNDSRVQK